MKILNRIKDTAIKYPVSIIGFTGSFSAAAVGLSYLYTSITQKNLYDFILSGGLISLGLIFGNFSKKVMKDERKFYEKISHEIEKKGFTDRHIRQINKDLLKTISEEKHLENEYQISLKKYSQ